VTQHGGRAAEHKPQSLNSLKLISLFCKMPSRQTNLQENTYFRVMRILQNGLDVAERELVEKLGICVSGLNYCLKALIGKGLVRMKDFTKL
jgi:hypothetical protein